MIESRRSPVARARTNGACVALLPVVEIVLVAVSSLKDSSSGVNWIDHKVVSQSSALSRVYALSEIFFHDVDNGWAHGLAVGVQTPTAMLDHSL